MRYLLIIIPSSLILLLTSCVPDANKKCNENQVLENGACVLKEQRVVVEPTPIPTIVPTTIPTITPVPTIQPKLSCGSIPHNGTESRIAYSATSVAYGQSCSSIQQTQTRTCNNGVWSAWSGSYQYLTCSVQAALACGTIASDAFEVRTMYQTAAVNEGQTCVSEIQNRKCTNGQFETWSGTYTQFKCVITRIRYESSTINSGETCKSQTQIMTCENAICGVWIPNTYTNNNCNIVADVSLTTSITQYGITWTFAAPVKYGQFANGDYWVVDPGDGVKIIKINPGHVVHTDGVRHMNGSMLNPKDATQGFDSGTFSYDVKYNHGIGVSQDSPLILKANNALVSTISNENPIDKTSFPKSAAILTCLNYVPAQGSFRPGYSDPDKTIYGTINNLDYSKLGKLTPTKSAPDPILFAQKFQRTWLMHSPSWTSRFIHPSDNIPDNYYYTNTLSIAALLLHCNFTNAQKEKLLINFIQHGIDLYGAIKARGYGWTSAAGVGWGRKWPILFAGIMLDSNEIKKVGQYSGDYLNAVPGYGPGGKNPPGYLRFAEDSLMFYVSQADVDRTSTRPPWSPDDRSGTAFPYTTAMIGMPEWGHRYSDNFYQVDAAWYAVYRTIGSGTQYIVGATLSAYIMGAKDLWNCKAHFDYVDRYVAISKGAPDPFGYIVPSQKAGGAPGGFVGEMFDTYRKNY